MSWVPVPTWHKLGMVTPAYDTSTRREVETGGFEFIFGYILNLKKPGLHQSLSQKEKQKTKMGRTEQG